MVTHGSFHIVLLQKKITLLRGRDLDHHPHVASGLLAPIPFNHLQVPIIMTDTQVLKTHEEAIMEGLTNICGLLHMFKGWADSMYPYKNILHGHDPKLMPQLIRTSGEAKIILKTLSKELIRDDDKAIDIMFETIGRNIGRAMKMSPTQREAFMEKVRLLDLEQ
jgi:hypothetical protein